VQAASLPSAGIRNPQQTRTSGHIHARSVHPLMADMRQQWWQVRLVPKAEVTFG
jgi:hypothetical protein